MNRIVDPETIDKVTQDMINPNDESFFVPIGSILACPEAPDCEDQTQTLWHIEHRLNMVLQEYGESIPYAVGNVINSIRVFVEDKIKDGE